MAYNTPVASATSFSVVKVGSGLVEFLRIINTDVSTSSTDITNTPGPASIQILYNTHLT